MHRASKAGMRSLLVERPLECDFIVIDRGQVVKAIQVCWYLSDENREREFGGVTEVLDRFSGCEGYILTLNQEEMSSGRLPVIPVWRWILQGANR